MKKWHSPSSGRRDRYGLIPPKMLFFHSEGLRDNHAGHVSLSPQEYRVLYAIGRGKDHAASHDEVLNFMEGGKDHAASHDEVLNFMEVDGAYHYTSRYLQRIVSSLRRKIKQLSPHGNYIIAVTGHGYWCRGLEHIEPESPKIVPIESIEILSLKGNQKLLFNALANPQNAAYTERTLAKKLGLKLNNFKYHRKKLYEKLGAVSRAHAIQIAQQYFAEREVA